GFTKRGGGNLSLNGNNLFQGPVTIGGGTVYLGHSNALGSALSGTSVQPGGALFLAPDVRVKSEALALRGAGSGLGAFLASGTNAWGGAILLNDDAIVNIMTNSQTEFSSIITSTGGLTKT